MSQWFYLGLPLVEPPAGSIGYVYKITRLDTGRMYIGKKLLQFRRTKQVRGVKKKVIVDSDWRTYYGSNQELKDEVAAMGESAFSREIIKFCYQKQECNYEETRIILEERALFQDLYYNAWVSVRITKKHVASALKKNKF